MPMKLSSPYGPGELASRRPRMQGGVYLRAHSDVGADKGAHVGTGVDAGANADVDRDARAGADRHVDAGVDARADAHAGAGADVDRDAGAGASGQVDAGVDTHRKIQRVKFCSARHRLVNSRHHVVEQMPRQRNHLSVRVSAHKWIKTTVHDGVLFT